MGNIADDGNKINDEHNERAIQNRVVYEGVSSQICECGNEIPEKRREQLPGIKTCVDCARMQEILDHRRGGLYYAN